MSRWVVTTSRLSRCAGVALLTLLPIATLLLGAELQDKMHEHATEECDISLFESTLNIENTDDHAIVIDERGIFRGGKQDLTRTEAACVRNLPEYTNVSSKRVLKASSTHGVSSRKCSGDDECTKGCQLKTKVCLDDGSSCCNVPWTWGPRSFSTGFPTCSKYQKEADRCYIKGNSVKTSQDAERVKPHCSYATEKPHLDVPKTGYWHWKCPTAKAPPCEGYCGTYEKTNSLCQHENKWYICNDCETTPCPQNYKSYADFLETKSNIDVSSYYYDL